MSTTIKRVALVAVAALSLGVISVAPSTAATQADVLTLSSATASQLTGETKTAGSAVASLSFLGATPSDTMSVSAYLVSAPAGNTVSPVLAVAETTSAIITNTSGGSAKAVGFELGQIAYISTNADIKAANAKVSVYLNGPTLAGTYVVKLYPAVVAGGGALNAAPQTVTITVAANPVTDTVVKSAKVILNKGETNSATTDAVVTSSKAFQNTAGNAAATISVALLNANGSPVTSESYTAILSGPGLLGSGLQGNAINASGRVLTVRNGDVVRLFADGTSGVATVTISTVGGVVLGTKTVTFYGDIASITATAAKPVIGVRPEVEVVSAKAYDAAGVLVTSGSLYISSADTTIITAGSSAVIDPTTGVALLGLTGVKAGTTTVVVGNAASASTVSSAAISVRVGGTSAQLANVTVTTDKSTYSPGEAAVITVTPVDAAGLTLGDDTYGVFAAGGITSSYVLGAGSDTLTASTVTTTAGVKKYTVYMPITEGDVSFSWKTGTLAASTANSAVAGLATVTASSAASVAEIAASVAS